MAAAGDGVCVGVTDGLPDAPEDVVSVVVGPAFHSGIGDAQIQKLEDEGRRRARIEEGVTGNLPVVLVDVVEGPKHGVAILGDESIHLSGGVQAVSVVVEVHCARLAEEHRTLFNGVRNHVFVLVMAGNYLCLRALPVSTGEDG